MKLFFDTETTGLPRNWKAPLTQLNNWPRLVQLAWLLYDDQENLVSEGNRIIKPEGFTIPKGATAVHGISTSFALEHGSRLVSVLEDFSLIVNQSNLLVAHNMNFDEKILGAEYLRVGLPTKLFNTPRLCTMETTTDFCQIPGNYGYKWPRLAELHQTLFRSDIQEAHDASVDVKACARCYFELLKRGYYRDI